MIRLPLVIFTAFELLYYLLIAQTGIVEYFHSNIEQIIYLPIGGVIGSLISGIIKLELKQKSLLFLLLQLLASLLYPNLNPLMLFILGIAVGGMAPIIVRTLRDSTEAELAAALIISYASGTLLFNIQPSNRFYIGVILTITILTCLYFIKHNKINNTIKVSTITYLQLLIMMIWVFLDSTLFETLSRDLYIPIWKGGFSLEIVLFHTIGVLLAVMLKIDEMQKELNIIIMFTLSYLFYFIHEAHILSIIYPIVISYYNVIILMRLKQENDFIKLSIYMVFIGWIASGAGLFIALNQLIIYVPIILVFLTILHYSKIQINSKEISYV